MSGTSIKRKERKNRVKSKKRQAAVKRLTKKPVLKNIDIEAIKEDFNKKPKSEKSSGNKPSIIEEADKVENKKTGKAEQPDQTVEAVKKDQAEAVESKKETADKMETKSISSPDVEKEKKKKDQEKGKSTT